MRRTYSWCIGFCDRTHTNAIDKRSNYSYSKLLSSAKKKQRPIPAYVLPNASEHFKRIKTFGVSGSSGPLVSRFGPQGPQVKPVRGVGPQVDDSLGAGIMTVFVPPPHIHSPQLWPLSTINSRYICTLRLLRYP